MSDALVSPTVAIVGGAAACTLIAISAKKVRHDKCPDLVALMGVMGAFVFTAQMINFSIPGTGSSGHLVGGILLSAILGPWAAFITLCSVLIVQCLIFADGGLLALGCNIVNMAVTSCLIAYPLIYRPIAGKTIIPWRLGVASITASIAALEIGAIGVTVETELSGITALPFGTFVSFMLPIHLIIGLIEGVATTAVLLFVAKIRPSILNEQNPVSQEKIHEKRGLKRLALSFAFAALLLGGLFSILASSNPDGLEWSIGKVTDISMFETDLTPTALMPDYDSSAAGIVGAVIVMAILWAFTTLAFSRSKKDKAAIQR